MQRHTRPKQARRRASQQIDLFAGEPQKALGDMPAVVRVADGDTSGTYQLDNTVDPGACRQGLDGGGRS
jgi:hypothetical protein